MDNFSGIKKLLDVMRHLRDPTEGCPWDRTQTHKSLLPYFFEELHEYQEAVLSEDPDSDHFQEELGDLLFQVVFHAHLLEENQCGSLDQIANKIAEKLIVRHPHVFDPKHPKAHTPEEVELQWEKRKAQKKKNPEGLNWLQIKKIPPSMGALARAQRIGEKAASLYGFDWKNHRDVLSKVSEEIKEIDNSQSSQEAELEFGDLLFALCQYARKRGWNAETAVANCNQKFIDRIQKMENFAISEGKRLDEMPLADQEKLWQKTKHT